jgi:hypothetical protein
LWERHAGGSLAGEQIADLDKRHFLAWRPRRLYLLVLLQAGLDDEEQDPAGALPGERVNDFRSGSFSTK